MAVSLVIFLFIKHEMSNKKIEITLVDRMPVGDFLLKADILDIAKETGGMMRANDIKLKDFFSHEFLLAAGKSISFFKTLRMLIKWGPLSNRLEKN